MNQRPPVIAVDGPSGVGKGTLCQWLATELGWRLLDSGALYRLTALATQRRNLPLTDESRVATVAAELNVEFTAGTDGGLRIALDGEEVSAAIRSEAAGNAASQVAALPQVRAALLQRQRNFRQFPGLIAYGRDKGTVVFPDAELKIFLIADPGERARRRYTQLSEKNLSENKMNVSLAALEREIAERDARDVGRAAAPLTPATDAKILDTTYLSIAQVCEWARQQARPWR